MIPLLTRPPQLPFPIRGLQGVWFLGRYNLLLDPRDFSSANWTKTNVTIATDSIAGPGGVVNADTLTATGAGGTCVQSFTGEASTQYAHGVWLKRKTGIGNISLQWKAGTSNVVAVDGTWQLFSPSAYTVAGAPEGLTPGVLIATSGDEVYAVAAQLNKGATLYPFEDRGTQQTLPIYRGTAGTLQRGLTTNPESTDPLLRNHGLFFDTDDYVKISAALSQLTLAGPWTVMFVAKSDAANTSGVYVGVGSTATNHTCARQWAADGILLASVGGGTTNYATSTGVISLTEYCCYAMTPTTLTRMDTGVVDTATAAPVVQATALLSLGSLPGGADPIAKATLVAVVLANVVYTPAERARMYAWLKSELAKPPYGLAVL